MLLCCKPACELGLPWEVVYTCRADSVPSPFSPRVGVGARGNGLAGGREGAMMLWRWREQPHTLLQHSLLQPCSFYQEKQWSRGVRWLRCHEEQPGSTCAKLSFSTCCRKKP